VASCRSVASCDLFLFTWSTLEPRTSPWTSTWRDSTSERMILSSAACVERVRREIGTAAIRVDDQPQEGCLVNGSSVLGTWRTQHDGSDTQTSYGAIRCQVTAVERADSLRRKFVNSRQHSYTAAVRLRPDLYDPMGAVHREYCNRMWRSHELSKTSGSCVWLPRVLQPDHITWTTIARASPDPTAIHGCGNPRDPDSAVNPGEKNGDHCVWSAPPSALEALVASWDKDVDRGILLNACRNGSLPNTLHFNHCAHQLGNLQARYAENILKWSANRVGLRLVTVQDDAPPALTSIHKPPASSRAAPPSPSPPLPNPNPITHTAVHRAPSAKGGAHR